MAIRKKKTDKNQHVKQRKHDVYSDDEAKAIKQQSRVLKATSGYEFSPSFIHIKGSKRYGMILRFDNAYPNNHDREFGWFIKTIPQVSTLTVKTKMFVNNKPAGEADKEKVKKNLDGLEASFMAGTSFKKKGEEDNKERTIKSYRHDDLENAKILLDRQHLTDTSFFLLITADYRSAIIRELTKIKNFYDNNLDGLRLVAVGGEQEKLFKQITDYPMANTRNFTLTSEQFAGFEHVMRRGISDVRGLPIGSLASSYSHGEAIMDFEHSLKGQALVATPSFSRLNYKEKSLHNRKLTASSLWCQLIANNIQSYRHRVYHIVLNDFEYFGSPISDSGKGYFFIPKSFNQEIVSYNMANGGINMLEMNSANTNPLIAHNETRQKIVEQINLFSERSLSTPAIDFLYEQLENFYIDSGLWTTNVAHDNFGLVEKTINPNNHESYTTIHNIISQFASTISGLKNNGGTREDIDRATQIKRSVERALDAGKIVFDSKTTLPNLDELSQGQLYFDLSGLQSSLNLQEAQFLNVLDYVGRFASKKDLVVIHGANNLSVGTMKFIHSRLQYMMKKDVRFLWSFDTIGSGKTKSEKPINERANIFNTQGAEMLYNDIDRDFDFAILGSMNEHEFDNYNARVNYALNNTLKSELTAKVKSLYYIRRAIDGTSNLVIGSFII